MFHGFDYPDETGEHKLEARFWRPKMMNGIVRFQRPEQCDIRSFIRPMNPKQFELGRNMVNSETEATTLGC
jgi:CRISPR-associated protein Cas5d